MMTRFGMTALAALLLFTACGDGHKSAEEGRSIEGDHAITTVCDASATAPVPESVPEALRPAAPDTVQRAETTDGKVKLVVSTTSGVEDVFGHYKTALAAAGFTIDDEDNEGREAELFFSKAGQKGNVLIKQSSCPPGSTAYQLTVPTA